MSQNVCCPKLLVVDCNDTDKHAHLLCGYSVGVISNETARAICIGNFEKCIVQSEEI